MEERPQDEGAVTLSVDDVIITGELAHRPQRQSDYAAENRALVALAAGLTADPEGTLQKVAELALGLCHADSAGISVLESEGGEELFRWYATAGKFAHHINGVMPRSASPCGTVITRNRVLLFNEAERVFPALRDIEPRIHENLLAPWEVNGELMGTVWAIKHTVEGRFDAEDARLLGSLARFAGVAYSFVERTRHASGQRVAALNLMEDAITARHEAERAYGALRESEARLQSIANLIPDLLWESAPDGSTNWYNQRWMEYTGQTFEQAVGWGWTNAIHPDDREDSARRYREAVETGESLRQEHRIRRHDGAYRWFVVNALPLKEDGRRVARMYGAATDIHEQRVALEAIRESEERLHRALSIETVGVIFFNEAGVFTGANEAFSRMSDYTREEMSAGGLNWEDLTPPEWMERSREAFAELMVKGRTTPYEKEYFRKDGSRFWGLFAASRIGEKESVEYVIDVSARRRAEAAVRTSEERLRLVVESVTDYAIFTMDERGRITSWNSGAQSMFGYSEEEAVGRHTELIFTPEDRERGAPEEEMRVAREQGRAADERWHLNKPGERFYVSGVLTPLRGVDGCLYGYAKIARDLTERKELEDALRRAHDELEERVTERTLELAEANVALQAEARSRASAEERIKRLLRQLITVQEEERRRIARELHDTLGQQLAALHLSVEMIKAESEEGTRLREHIARTRAILERLNSDVDFLAWELRPAALDPLGLDAALQTFVREWSQQFGVEADYRGFDDTAPRLAPEVETNLYRILQEALQNVHKHAGATHVSVLLEQRDGRAVLIVEDNGCGYDAAAEERAGTNKGMGVTNMRERAALLGGELEIESTAGAGTTIYIRVPAGGLEKEGAA